MEGLIDALDGRCILSWRVTWIDDACICELMTMLTWMDGWMVPAWINRSVMHTCVDGMYVWRNASMDGIMVGSIVRYMYG